MNLSVPYNVAASRFVSVVLPQPCHEQTFEIPDSTYSRIFLFRLIGIVVEICLPTNAYFPRTPDCTLFILGHVFYLIISNFAFVYVDSMVYRNTILVC